MRQFLTICCLSISFLTSAQSLFDKNSVTADEMRKMIREIFSSEKNNFFKQAEMQSGRGVLLLTDFEPGNSTSNENRDVEAAIFEIYNYPNLRSEVPIEFADRNTIGLSTGEEFERATTINVFRNENEITFNFGTRDVYNKKVYRLIVIFEKQKDDWKYIKEQLITIP